MTQYSLNQQVFCHTMLSNRSNNYNDLGLSPSEIAAKTQTDINTVLQSDLITPSLGNWNIVWNVQVQVGVCKGKNKVINTMYIAANSESKQIVAAIAGTDPKSVQDWITEDFEVFTEKPWSDFVPGQNAKISKATYDGLTILTRFTSEAFDPVTGASVGTLSASDYLQNHTPDGWSITVSGHSLGGALAPSLGLYMYQNWGLKNPNVTFNVNIAAGPTPGNKDFFDAYSATPLNTNTIRLWNTNDIVPHAWNDLSGTLDLYSNINGPACQVKVIIEALIVAMRAYTYTPLPGGVSFSSGLFKVDSSKSNFDQYLSEVGCQHVASYPTYYQLTDFQITVGKLFDPGNPIPYFSGNGCTLA